MKGLSLILWIWCASVWAVPNSELLANLRSRFHPSPMGGVLIKSFTHHNQSYVYDQALATIALIRDNDQKSARELLKAMENLQLPDGSLYFSYYLTGQSPYPTEGDKRYSGAIAWIALAAIHYQNQFDSKEFYKFNHKLLHYLDRQMDTITISDKTHRALKFNPTDVPSTPWREDDTAAIEHNLDAYSAFLHFNHLNPQSEWKKNVTHLKTFILSMWDNSRSHFWSGASIKNSTLNRQELYLDNQSWTLLALDNETLANLDMKEALRLNCEAFMVDHEGIQGFMDSKPLRKPASSKFVWSEGTAGQILAMKRFGRISNEPMVCNKKDADHFLRSIKKMKTPDGGIAYATTTTNPDFTTSSSVAGTAWLYFAANDFNPFQVKRRK